jgi:hypothetical protein
MRRSLVVVSACAIGFLAAAGLACAQGVAFNPATYSVGPLPTYVLAADVNGDGWPDLVSVENLSRGTLTVLTNDGTGNFVLSAILNVGTNPVCVVAVDVNGDGSLDLVCADFGGSSRFAALTILTNDGTGVFGSNATVSLPSSPVSLAAADVNGDGSPDLIVANQVANTLTILTNNGSGVFGSNATLVVGSEPSSVVAADLNQDGKPDLVCANFGANSLSVFTNNGSGTFGSNATLKVGTSPFCVVAADVNGDGIPDLVSVNYGSNSVTVLQNDGHGGFNSSATYAVGVQPESVVAADLNGDGRLDLACANYHAGGPGSVTVLTNNGTGGFATDATLAVTNLTDWITAADVNGDGKADLLCASVTGYPYNVGTLTVLLNATPAPTRFPLYITGSSSQVVVSWPTFAAGYLLQTNSDLVAGQWRTSGHVVTTDAGIESVTVSPAAGRLFFRLVQP